MDGGRKAFCPGAPIGLNCADDLGRGIGLDVEAVLHDRFYSQRAGNFAVGFAPHAVGKHKEVQRPIDLVAIFVVRTHATHIGHAAACDSHPTSPCPRETTPRPTRVPANCVPKLTEPQVRRKALNPTDYSLTGQHPRKQARSATRSPGVLQCARKLKAIANCLISFRCKSTSRNSLCFYGYPQAKMEYPENHAPGQ